MTPSEYDAFIDKVRAEHDDETAARIIERTCHPPYPLEDAEDEAEGGAA